MIQRYVVNARQTSFGPIADVHPNEKGPMVMFEDHQSRVERLEAALRFVWDLADLNCWEVGVQHASTDLVAQRLTYRCSGCEVSVVRSPETNGVALAAMNFPHGADCKYVQFRDLAESVGNDAGEGA